MPLFRETRELSEREKLNWLRLIRTENVGPITFYKLLESFGTAEKAIEEIPNIAKRGGRSAKLKVPSMSEIENEYKRLKKLGGDIICSCEPYYSKALASCDDRPPVLSYIGNIELLNKECISIIGNRNPTIASKNLARTMSAELGQKSFCISSGMASGIDTCAHEGALRTGTIAVLGGGVDVIYPKEANDLYHEIAKKGLIISEVPLGTQPIARHFPKRNRIVAGLAKATVVIEAKVQSGSLITARQALDYGREVMAVPGHALEPKAKGTNGLIQRQGAYLVMSANDVLEAMTHMIKPLFKEDDGYTFDIEPINNKEIKISDLEEIENTIMDKYISFTPIKIDEIITESQIPVNMILTCILDLELAGEIERHPGNKISKI